MKPDDRLPRLRRARRFDVPGFLARFSSGIAEIDGQVEPYASRWDEANHLARTDRGPLWVALGDSSSQGVGASEWANGWVHDVLGRLRTTTGEPWRIINLSMSGGRFLDVVDHQLPVMMDALPTPDLVTCVIGGNDLMWRRGTEPIYRDAERTVAALPPASVVSRVGGNSARRRRVNEIFATGAADRGHRLFNIWAWPSGRGALAADRVHPGDLGYTYMAELAWSAIAARLSLSGESPNGRG